MLLFKKRLLDLLGANSEKLVTWILATGIWKSSGTWTSNGIWKSGN